jgi:hypothetical protein
MALQQDLSALQGLNPGGSTSRIMGLTGNIGVQQSAAGLGNAADTTDDVLFTFALPTGSFDQANRQVNIFANGKFAANGNNKRVKIWWGTTTQTVGSAVAGGTLIFDSGVQTGNAVGWQAQAQVTKYGANASNTQQSCSSGMAGATHLGSGLPVSLTAVESGAINVTLTGASPTSSAASDVLAMMFDVQFSN